MRKFLRRFFQKATANPTRGALVAARTRRNLSCGVFFFAKLFSLRLYCQRKKRVNDLKRLCVERGTPTCVFSLRALPEAASFLRKHRQALSSLRLAIHPSWRFLTAQEFRALRGVTSGVARSSEFSAKTSPPTSFWKSSSKTFKKVSPQSLAKFQLKYKNSPQRWDKTYLQPQIG